jgi:hypothetical protein
VIRAHLRSERRRKGGWSVVNGYDGSHVLDDGKDEEVALTSRWPARVVLLTTWQISGGPSSRNVADGIAMG